MPNLYDLKGIKYNMNNSLPWAHNVNVKFKKFCIYVQKNSFCYQWLFFINNFKRSPLSFVNTFPRRSMRSSSNVRISVDYIDFVENFLTILLTFCQF